MHDSLPNGAAPALSFAEPRVIAPGVRASLGAVAWLLSSLATAAFLFGLGIAMSRQSERDAARMIIAAQGGAGYLTTVVEALAARQGRPHPR